MDGHHPPEVVRERVSRLGGERLSCALIFEREFSPEEIARFYGVQAEGSPAPADFEIESRVIRYDCPEADEARWRLAAEIFLVKAFREAPPRRQTSTDVRRRMGLHSLYR
jgi:hypothetical protein